MTKKESNFFLILYGNITQYDFIIGSKGKEYNT